MLEFIVLGLVPGTQIQLNFEDIMMISFTMFFFLNVLTTASRAYHTLRIYRQAAFYFTIVARKHWLTRRIKSLSKHLELAEYSAHTAEALPANTAVLG